MFLKNQVKAHLMEKHAGVLEELGEGPDMLFCTLPQGESSKGFFFTQCQQKIEKEVLL